MKMNIKVRGEECNLTKFMRKIMQHRQGWLCVNMSRSYQTELNRLG